MTDHDLTQIGIEAFGARRRMQQAIAGSLRLPRNKSFIYSKEKASLSLFRSRLGQYQSIFMIMIKNFFNFSQTIHQLSTQALIIHFHSLSTMRTFIFLIYHCFRFCLFNLSNIM